MGQARWDIVNHGKESGFDFIFNRRIISRRVTSFFVKKEQLLCLPCEELIGEEV